MKKIKANVIKFWYLYLICLIIFPLLSSYVVELINKPRNEETISIFIGSCSSSSKELVDKLSQKKPSYLREINVRNYVYYGEDFSYFYSSFGKSEADLIILPESKINNETCAYYYAKLDPALFPNESFYFINENKECYGLLLHKKEEENSSLISYKDDTHDENYYAFFNRNSLHIGALNDSNWDTALSFYNIIKKG
ncbi:MAG TPA: hypothetical protein DD377_02755 [Firmicutes bacterium]|nr:hypothetical protein [Bacillota bacterium]HBM70292.1 hypothetical protein [Bacillota bacterium]